MQFILKDLESIILEQKVITSEQLDVYLNLEKKSPFLDYLIDELKIDPDLISKAISISLNIEEIKVIDESGVDMNLLSKIPLKFLRDNNIFPYIQNNNLIIISANPSNYEALDEIRLVLGQFKILVGSKNLIQENINRYYPMEGTKKVMEELEAEGETAQQIDFNVINEEDILGAGSEAPIIKLVNNILFQAVKNGASDIHIEPFEKELRVRYRIDGSLYTKMTPPKRVQSALSSRIKILSQLNIAEKRQPQDGRIQLKITGKPIDIRVSILPVVFGENIVMRLLDKSKSFIAIEELGTTDRDLQVIKDGISQPNGIVLVTGPTGSGKTSTLYAVLHRLNTPDTCIITVEDPVEYQMAGICQVQVREKIGLTFAAALRSILRQDPDVVMIGETRDKETAQIAIQAALTGHIVLSTLHTNSACASITRLIDMGVEPFLIASTLTVVIAQRLVRKLCEKCREEYKPTEEELRRLGAVGNIVKDVAIFKAKGCPACMGSGYRGRLPIFEVLKMSPGVVKLTLERTDASKIEEVATKEGMTLLVEDGLRKVKMGKTTIEEVLAVANSH